jgi:OPT family oligopeptide transporter
MPLFQPAPQDLAELDAQRPLETSPDEVQELDEAAWYARIYRGADAPQLTVRAVLMGSGLGFLLAFTNLYIGLKTGFLLGVAITASVLSFAVWSAFLKLGLAKTPLTILETNCAQSTASSAGYATGATVISAFPALLMLSATPAQPRGTQLPVWLVASFTAAIALLGVVLAIPLKRGLINRERLRFPSGTAAAMTLHGLHRRGQEGMARARALLRAGLFAMAIPLLKDLTFVKTASAGGRVAWSTLLPAQSHAFDWLGSIAVAGRRYPLSDFNIKLDHGVALLAAGALVGLRTTSWMLVSALVLALLIAPQALTASWTAPGGATSFAASSPAMAWYEIGLWVGAPLLVAASLTSLLLASRGLLSRLAATVRSRRAGAAAAPGEVARTEVPRSWFVLGGGLASLVLVSLGYVAFGIPPLLGALAIVLTFALGAVACRVTGESDMTPMGAMGKITQLTYGVLIPQSVVPNVMTAAITSGSACASADLLNDLKSGYLLGAHPRRQVLAQALGIVSGTLASVLGYYLLVPDATALTGAAGAEPTFPAPAALQFKAVAELFERGIEQLHPMARSAMGMAAAAGIALAALEHLAPARARRLLPSATGLGLGFMLPFYYPLAMFLGALLAYLVGRVRPAHAEHLVTPVAAGLMAGESIMGVLVAALNLFVFG